MKYKRNIGYVANVVESFNDEDGIITQYDFKQNTYSDQQFAKDTIEKMPEGDPDNKTKLIVDVIYYTDDNAEKAVNKNIELIPTQLVGKKPDDGKLEYHEFKVYKSKNIIIFCPIGEEPYDSYTSNKSYISRFDRDKC